MKIRRRYKNNSKINILLPLVFLFVVFLSVGYSSLNQELNITSEAVFRVEEDIRITDIKLVGNTFNGIENYNSSYSKDRIKTGITLNEANSSITYQVTITNTGNVPMNLTSLDNINYNNDGITYELNEKLPFMVNKGEEKKIEITYKWNSYNEESKNLDSVIKFNFIKAESVLAKGSTSLFINNRSFDRSKVESIRFMPTIEVPSSAIEAWDASLNKDGSVMAYILDNDSNDLYELYIAGYGEIKLSEASYLFQKFTNMVTLDFNNLVTTDNVTTMKEMFRDCSKLKNVNLNNWSAKKLINLDYIFFGSSLIEEIEMNNFSAPLLTSTASMFSYAKKLQRLNINNWNISKVANLSSMFSGLSSMTTLNMEGFNAPSGTNVSSMFSGCSKLESVDLSIFDTSNVTLMSSMFSGCSSLTSVDLSNFDTSNVTTMSSMFNGCSTLKSIDLSHFNTSNVTTMFNMFRSCIELTSIDLSNFNVSNVTTMKEMFRDCSKLKNVNLNNWSVENLTEVNDMFANCTSLKEIDFSLVNSETYEKDIFKSMLGQIGNITFYVKDSECKTLMEAIKPNATIEIKSV